jgi:5-formyltetrahydrofolate cyclo-ligase
MNSRTLSSKAELRRELRLAQKSTSQDAMDEASARACARLRRQAVWKAARSVLFYSPIAGELDLTPLIKAALEAGKIVLLPRYDAIAGSYEAVRVADLKGDCAPGKFGIAEPGSHCAAYPLKSLDLALVPGLGFDSGGRRLGRGRGFYDRLLAQVAGLTCGVALDQQVVEEIPSEEHDIPVDFILTPTRWLAINR